MIFRMYLVITFLLVFNNVESSPIFDTIGTGNICNTNTGGYSVDCRGEIVGKKYDSFHQDNWSIASAFTVPSNGAYTLTSIEVPMSIERSPNNINIELRKDSQGSPGEILKSWNFIDEMKYVTHQPTSILVGTSSHTPEIILSDSETYWLSSSASISDTSAFWHTSVSNTVSGTTAQWNQSSSSEEDWNVYQDSTLSAFRINGDLREIPFTVSDQSSDPTYNSRMRKTFIDNERGLTQVNHFDKSSPTYIVTHGWQPDADHSDGDWNFSEQPIPPVQVNISSEIIGKLSSQDTPFNFNIIEFEWEGAYTGGKGFTDGESLKNASQEARINADYAGVLLGNALANTLGQGYSQDIHFIGHSYGTIVNGVATRYLENQNVLNTDKKIQFTTLDPPTDAPRGYAPNFDRDWFHNMLPSSVDYLDNYYSDDLLLGYGEPIDGAGLNKSVGYDHSDVGRVFYPDLIRNGKDAVVRGIRGVITPIPFEKMGIDWITPILDTYDERPGDDFSQPHIITIEQTTFENYIAALGTPIIAQGLPGYDSYGFVGLLLKEQSPVSAFQVIDIPLNTEWLSFDWMVGAGGDGDWFTVYFGSDLLWTMTIDTILEGVLLNALIDISDYAGVTGELYFTLNSVGNSNAEFYVGNVALSRSIGSTSAPEPSTFSIILFGIGGAGYRKYRKNIENARGYGKTKRQ